MRTGLGQKISLKIFCINAKLGFQLYETDFNKTTYTSSSSELVKSYQVISFYFKFTVHNCIVKFSFPLI